MGKENEQLKKMKTHRKKKDEDHKQGATERGLYNYLLNYERSNNGMVHLWKFRVV